MGMFKISMSFYDWIPRFRIRYGIFLHSSLMIDPDGILRINQHTLHSVVFYSLMYGKVDESILYFGIEG